MKKNRGSGAVTKIRAKPLIVNLLALRHARTMEVMNDMTAHRDDAYGVMSAISDFLGE